MTVDAQCPVEEYARKVVDGHIVAGRLVRLACQRHLDDLRDGPARGLCWDTEAARYALRFFGWLCLPEGGKPFALHCSQAFIVGSLFGWKGPDGLRRFRTAYVEEAKGSGKSPLAAGIGLLGLVADHEPAAEVYAAAVTREQASIMFRDAKNIAEASPHLAKRLEIGQHNIAHHASSSFMRPVSSEHRGLDGKRVHVCLIDEVHEHPTPLVVDKMRANTKGRKQALIFEITNSGHDRTTVCWQHHEYSEKVLMGLLADDSWFAYVCTLDPCKTCQDAGHTQPVDGCKECDDWQDERVWSKVNPLLDAGVPGLKYLREQVREAQGMVTKQNIVKRLNFCMWTEVADRIIPMDRWDACRKTIDRPALKGRRCYLGLDLGAISDFTALVCVFPEDDVEQVEIPIDLANPAAGTKKFYRRSYKVQPFFWLPEVSVKRDHRMQSQIDAWGRMGLIRRVGGNIVDYDLVFDDICKLSQEWDFVKLMIDYGFQAAGICRRLMDYFGAKLVESFRQGIVSMAAPFRELQEMIVMGRLHHDGNPVMRWMASNVAAETKGGLVKPSKDKSGEKIDGITALTMALAPAIADTSLSWYSPSVLRN